MDIKPKLENPERVPLLKQLDAGQHLKDQDTTFMRMKKIP